MEVATVIRALEAFPVAVVVMAIRRLVDFRVEEATVIHPLVVYPEVAAMGIQLPVDCQVEVAVAIPPEGVAVTHILALAEAVMGIPLEVTPAVTDIPHQLAYPAPDQTATDTRTIKEPIQVEEQQTFITITTTARLNK